MSMTQNSGEGRPAPLEGLLVIDLSRYIAGPYCTMLMADAGATVVKVEPPNGDDTRRLEPYVETDAGDKVSAYYIRMNRRKKSIALDLKDPDDRVTLESLIAKADVVVENFAAGVFAKLGFGEERISEINPRIVYCSISGFGHTESPMRNRPAYNIVAEYEAGVYFQTDRSVAPAPLGPPVGDMFPALHALGGLMMALYRRERTGQGGRVDISMYDSMLSLNEIRSSYSILYGKGWDPSDHPFYSPYGVFAVQDGYVCIDVTTTGQWHGFCQAIGHPEMFDIPGLETGPQRVENFDEVIAEPLYTWLSAQSRDSAVETLAAHRVPCAAIREPGEALMSDQARSRGMELPVTGEQGVVITTPGNPIRIDAPTAGGIVTASALDEDRDWVLREILGR
ncbi:MAG: CoA transferase [Nocardioidaceae bacterium]